MLSFAIAFLLGDLYLQTLPILASKILIWLLLAVASLICIPNYRYKYLLIACLLGFSWSAWYTHTLLSWTLPTASEGQPLWVTGTIVSLPVTDVLSTRFELMIEQTTTRIRLAWQNPNQALRAGDKWRLQISLKRIHGTQSPGAFDVEAWSLEKGLRASGYVLANKNNALLSRDWYRYPILRLRQILQAKIQTHLPSSSTAPWLMALIIGERAGMAKADWEVLRNTGTNHLMAIAGLHIGIIAGFAHTITQYLWRRLPTLVLLLPAGQAGACAALLVALFYSALSGFSLPTQRACLMLTVYILAHLSRRQTNAWHAWSLALLIVLLLNPLSVLSDSFWLSFGTIALIIYGLSGRLAPSGWWWKWGRSQWVIGLGLVPLSLLLFHQCSIVSFVSNCIAIPWLGLLILPFCLLSSIFLFLAPNIGGFFLVIADKSLAALWIILSWLAQLHFSVWQQIVPTHLLLILTLLGFIMLLLPAGFPGRWLGLVWLMPLILFKSTQPLAGEIWMTMLDVGQGLAVVVQTQNHTLVFDTGPKYAGNMDMGESVVLPYLLTQQTKQIDALILSHGDNDHVGGAQALASALPIKSVYSSVPEKSPTANAQYCIAGITWQWDEVNFTFLHPTADMLTLGNDSSCVLRIDNGEQSILLPGDIEKSAEYALLAKLSATTILIAPHHGSKTSGVSEFIDAVQPRFVLYSVGYRNRYHFPHPSIVQAYRDINAIQLATADKGTIQFRLRRGEEVKPELYREMHKRYWMD